MTRSVLYVASAVLCLTMLYAPNSVEASSHLSQDPQVNQARTLIDDGDHQAALKMLRPLADTTNIAISGWMLFSHNSAEPGHQLLLQSLSAQPLLSLSMRLGEGSGAAVAVNILKTACALHNGMATFEEAGVSEQ